MIVLLKLLKKFWKPLAEILL
ncbi:DUF2514 domain-containing protein, partial [Salmonella enterica subsp. enterica]|nr:DUF2514 domain-containing protein [Salmonella enterica subsp. enterica]